MAHQNRWIILPSAFISIANISLNSFGITASRVINIAAGRMLAAFSNTAFNRILKGRTVRGNSPLLTPCQCTALIVVLDQDLAFFSAISAALLDGSFPCFAGSSRPFDTGKFAVRCINSDGTPTRLPTGTQINGLLLPTIRQVVVHGGASMHAGSSSPNREVPRGTITFRQ